MDFRVVRVAPAQIALQWEDAGIHHHPLEVYVQRAGAYTGPYVEIAGPIRDYNAYNDTNLLRGTKPFYRLRFVRNGESVLLPATGGLTISPTDTLAIEEVRYRIYLDLYYGEDLCLYYPVKSSGQRCSCYDTVRGRKDAKHLSCFGTGFVGGFYNPIVLPLKRTPKQEGLSGDTDREKGSALHCFFPGIFLLHKGDVFVDSTNDRFVVSSATAVSFRGATVKQSVVAAPVPSDSMLCQLPVDLSLLKRPARLVTERTT